MKRTIFSISAAAALTLVLAACGNAPSETAGKSESGVAQVEEARLVAALSYADWCGSCQTLDPKITKARADGDFGAAFVTLDYTVKDAEAFFNSADAAGIGEVVRAKYSGGVKTGQLLLIDVDDAEIIQIVTKEMTAAEIAEAVRTAAAGA